MPIPRFRVRTLMIAVAVVGLCFPGFRSVRRLCYWRTATVYRQLVHELGEKERRFREDGAESDRVARSLKDNLELRRLVERNADAARRRADEYAAKRRRLEFAASNPWTDVGEILADDRR